MSNALRNPGAAKQEPGKRRQPWTERAARRALRAAGQDRILRILPDGTMELVPLGEGAERKAIGKDDWKNI